MWAEACELLDRAERLQRQFFQPGMRTLGSGWEPPVDIFETELGLWVIVALPGVSAERLELSIDSGALVVSGVRLLPAEVRNAAIHRLEIPAGRFQRLIELPHGRFDLAERRFADGCLTLGLRRLPENNWGRP
jgi:HSP20 family molecular chaperone IbpA